MSFALPRPRWALQLQAQVFRQLMEVGMVLHRTGEPRPPSPAFTRTIASTISAFKDDDGRDIELLFYTPAGYATRPAGARLPVVVNFHGGGFTIGRASDDARWAMALVDHVGAVVVSVDYRLAPEYPFPTSVEDGADAVLWLVQHADELGIDSRRIAISGFSAGGNLAFTVPIRLQAELRWRRRQSVDATTTATTTEKADPAAAGPLPIPSTDPSNGDEGGPNDGNIVAIVAWYPSTDFATNTRSERRRSNLRPDKELPKIFTDLFDASYLYPPKSVSMSDPYLSPGLAPAAMLRRLPRDIIMYTCEWDELLVEAERFRDRLLTEEIGKNVRYRKVEGVAHAWDKSPNFLLDNALRDEVYAEACAHLKRVFEERDLKREA